MRDRTDVDVPLRRPTARARRALLWAQIAAGGLVIVAAAAVGGAVQDRLDEHLPGPIRVGSGVDPQPVTAPAGDHDGSLAAIGTLLVGWTLTAAGGTAGRRRLDDLEDARWTAEWAGVEPIWSGRVR